MGKLLIPKVFDPMGLFQEFLAVSIARRPKPN
jgi:hypothetical protein